MIHQDRLDDLSDHATGYRYDVIRGVRCQERRGRLVQQLLHVLWRLLLSALQSLQAKQPHIQLRYLLEKFHDAVVRSQP